RSDHRPLKDSRTKVSSASTIPLKLRGLWTAARAQKPMSPAERRRRMNAAQLRGLGQALALDHRPGVIEPFLLLAQMRHRRLGQRIEGAPTALAAKPQKSVRAAPTDDLASRAMRTALSRDALVTGRSQRVLLAATLAGLLRSTPPPGPDRARLLKRRDRLRALPLVHPRNRRQPSRKILSLHRIAPSIRPTLNKPTANAIRAHNFFRNNSSGITALAAPQGARLRRPRSRTIAVSAGRKKTQ